MANYRLTVTISQVEGSLPWTTTISLPSFVYEGEVLGIVSAEHAEQIAESTFQQLLPKAGIHACAFKLDEPRRDSNGLTAADWGVKDPRKSEALPCTYCGSSTCEDPQCDERLRTTS